MASTPENCSPSTNEETELDDEFLQAELGIEPSSEEHAFMVSFQRSYNYCDWKKLLPVGFRFKPTDEELVADYLYVKKNGSGVICNNIISDLDIYQHEPSKLKNFAYDNGDKSMYFFSPLHKRYTNGLKAKRVTPDGFWKATQSASPVKDKDGKEIGTKTPLAYYSTTALDKKGKKTHWLMQEYRLCENKSTEQTAKQELLDEYVLCVIYLHKEDSGDQSNHGNNQSPMPSMDGYPQNFGEGSCSVSGAPSCSNYVVSPFPEQLQTPCSEPNTSSYNNLEMASCSNPQNNSCPGPTSNTNISSKRHCPIPHPTIYPPNYASCSNHVPSPEYRRAMDMPFPNSRRSTSSILSFNATSNSIMQTPNHFYSPQLQNITTSRASFNPKLDISPFKQSYYSSNPNFHGSNISPMPNIDHCPFNSLGPHYDSYMDPINEFVTENFEHNSIQSKQHSYNNPDHVVHVDSNPFPDPVTLPCMNYTTHQTINILDPSPSSNPFPNWSTKATTDLDQPSLSNQHEPSDN